MSGLNAKRYIDITMRTTSVKHRVKPVLVLLSLFVVIVVFWCLKLTGITLAGEAFCGKEEHEHSDACYVEVEECMMEEHVHIVSCYSDITADLENSEVWEATFAEVETELTLPEKTLEIAKTQLGYMESEKNFVVDTDEVRRGYTRYGEWYGNPYGDWSTLFTSFCLRYAGYEEHLINAGADAMRLAWEEAGRYRNAEEYVPVPGDVVFLNKNENEAIDSTAIVCEVTEDEILVIEGDVENQVAEVTYALDDERIIGYGSTAVEVVEIETKMDEVMYAAAPIADMRAVAQTVAYSTSIFNNNAQLILYTVGNDGKYYAIDGNSNAVEIQIDGSGRILTSVSDLNSLYWTFEYCGYYDNQVSYYIRNVSTGMYLHPFREGGGQGAILSGRWESALYPNGTGVRIRGARQNAYAQLSGAKFTAADNLYAGSTLYFGKALASHTVWLDGTQGQLMSLRGSPNQSYTVVSGNTITLPTEWDSPPKYNYKLQGWYDIINAKYYPAGSEVVVTDNMVFYAYWEAASYDIGTYNTKVADTVSTNDFVTTRMFDYNALFNVQSSYAKTTVDASGHSEEWILMANGTVPYKSQNTLNYIFRDWDRNRDISWPSSTNNQNTNGDVYSGLYNDNLGNILFGTDNSFNPATGEGIIGKKYLGTADHLFQFMTDPSDELYGYYYYDSGRNAAAYNQADNRFYVYEYLERTSDSANVSGDGIGKYSDFLPLNSPYANTNGHNVVTYSYDGEHGEYVGVPHCAYDAKYDSNGSATGNVQTNFGFGMSIDVDFYLPETPGSRDENGNYGNQDIYGKDMHFHFSGDDDVWVLIDGKLALDIGGVHGVEVGDINFSTGVVSVNGEQAGTINWVEPGEHKLTIYYLERGSSQSNCAIYFNLAPRFSLSIQKEDVLTRDVLNGAQFSVYTNKECSKPAQLWVSKEAYKNKEAATNTFTVEDGIASMWGFGAGQTYYIKETKAPDASDYSRPNGIIKLTIDKKGIASYSVEMLEEAGDIAEGFTVHGFKIDEDTQEAFIVATNAPDWVNETTSILAMKKWDDTKDHTYDEVTVYLTVTSSDGSVRRIREITLSEANDWRYVWDNLPKYEKDGVTPIKYSVEEGYTPGYYSKSKQVNEIKVTKTTWTQSYNLEKGKSYLLKGPNGYLSATSPSSNTYRWVDETTAKNSQLALWTTSDKSGNYCFTNGVGQRMTYNPNYEWGNYTVEYSVSDHQTIIPVNTGNGYKLFRYHYNNNYFGPLQTDGKASFTNDWNTALTFIPMEKTTTTENIKVDGYAFEITNTPLEYETSLKVSKAWEVGAGTSELYDKAQVTVKLLANGKETGRIVILNLKNGWTDTFRGLPYVDDNGIVIQYSVEEVFNTDDWIIKYGEVTEVAGSPPTYETTVTNVYRWGRGYELPATGGRGPGIWTLGGLAMMIGSLGYGYMLRRKRERRSGI